ncbi:MAG: dihydrofolate reductase [Candidatus Doudnabacteria bacterium]|nr:dihydrofolate reductase [Candidatus Doudnabacteria bacterium]
MKKIIVFNLVTVDGYFAGPNGEIDWHKVDDEFNDFAIKQLQEAGSLWFGRVTYELMANYWPSEQVLKTDPIVAGLMNSLPKVVFSKMLQHPDWQNTQLVKDIDVEEIKKIKTQPGKDIYIFGSGQLVQQFTAMGLVDEYRLMVNPVVLGEGKPLFKGKNNKQNLKFIRSREFKNGNVLMVFEPLMR